MVVKIKYCSPSIDNEDKVRFSKFDLNMDEDLRLMWNTFHRYETKDPIKVNATIASSTNDILKMLKLLKSSTNV